MCTRKPAVLLLQMVHGSIELVEKLVIEVGVVHQVPLSPGVVITLSVTNSGEVQPLRVAELVADEVKITFPRQGVDQQPDGLVEGEAPGDGGGGRIEGWWWGKRNSLPILSGFSDRYMCVQASSTPSERVFSCAGHAISQERSRILPEKANMLIFLQKNC